MSQQQSNILYILITLLLPFSAFSFDEKLDSLHKELESCKKISGKDCFVQLNRSIGQIYFEEKNYKLALQYFSPIDSILSNQSPNLVYLENLYDLCYIQYNLNEFEISLEIGKKLLQLEVEQYSPKLLAKVLRQLSVTNRALGNFEEAYQHNMDALQVYDSLSDSLGISKALYSNGSLFFYQKNYKQALKFYLDSWKISKSIKNPPQIFRCLGGIGASYDRLQQVEQSIQFNKQALELAETMASKTNIAYAAHNLGSNYAMIENYKFALKYFLQSLNIKKELNDEWGQIGTLGAIGNLFIATHNAPKAIEYLKEALAKSKKLKSKTREVEIYNYLAEAHYANQNTNQGFLYLKKYIALQDSLFNKTTLKEMGEIKNKYEFQKKENEIILLTKQSEIDELQTFLSFGAAFGLLLFSILVLRQNRSQRQSNLLLEEKNKEIQEKNAEVNRAYHLQQQTNLLLAEKNKVIQEKNEEVNKAYLLQQEVNQLLEVKNEKIKHQNILLESSNEDLKQFAYVASHDLKEPLRMIGAYTSLLKRRYISKLDNDAQEFMHYIVDGAKRMDILLTDLLSYSRANSQEVPQTPVNIQDVMAIVSNNLRTTLYQKEATLEVDYNILPTILGSQTHLVQLFQNLISNGIKFTGDKKPIVKVDCYQKEEQFILSIKDNGIGIDDKNKEAIFEMFRRLHSREEYEGTGIGLATCKKIVERHGGKIWVESVVGEGSTFFFSLPVSKEILQEV